MQSQQSQSTQPILAEEAMEAFEGRRRRGFKIYVLLFVICLAAGPVMGLIWARIAKGRLDALVASYRAAGEPVLAEDYNPPPHPAEEETSTNYHLRAARAIVEPEGTQATFDEVVEDAYLAARGDVEIIAQANRKALDLLRQSRQLPAPKWGPPVTRPMSHMEAPDLFLPYELARVATIACLQAFRRGNHQEVVELWRDNFAIRAEHPLGLVPVDVELACNYLTLRSVEELVADLDVGANPPAGSRSSARASKQQILALIGDLSQEERLRRNWRDGMWAERATSYDSVRLIAEEPRRNSHKAIVFADYLQKMGWLTRIAGAAREATYQKAADRLPTREQISCEGLVGSTLHASRWIGMRGYASSLARHYRNIAQRRMATLALAIKLYETDHGERPEVLSQLVPEYLDRVPIDPFDPHASPLRYLPHAPSPLLYSFGKNGVDDGGKFVPEGETSRKKETRDQVFFLNGDRPPEE